MELSKAIRLRVKKLLDENKFSGNQLSLSAGISRSNVSRFLKGQHKTLTIESITLICQACNITLKDFFDDKVFDDVEVND